MGEAGEAPLGWEEKEDLLVFIQKYQLAYC